MFRKQTPTTPGEKDEVYECRGWEDFFSTFHQGFDLISFNRDVGHEIALTRFGDEHGVFQANVSTQPGVILR